MEGFARKYWRIPLIVLTLVPLATSLFERLDVLSTQKSASASLQACAQLFDTFREENGRLPNSAREAGCQLPSGSPYSLLPSFDDPVFGEKADTERRYGFQFVERDLELCDFSEVPNRTGTYLLVAVGELDRDRRSNTGRWSRCS